MILIFPLFLGAICAATAPHRPVDLHQCSLVKFDLNDLDNALYMYKACSALTLNLTDAERLEYLTNLRNKMDVACISLVLGCGVDVNNWVRNKRDTKESNTRKQKLYKLMNYLTDAAHVEHSGFNQTKIQDDMDSRVRRGLIHTIQERVDRVHDRLSGRCAAFKRSPGSESTEKCETETVAHSGKQCTSTKCTASSTACSSSPTSCMNEYVVGNVGMVIIALFLVSAILCLLSLLICKICCLTDFSIAAIHMWTKKEKCEKPKKRKRKKACCRE